MPAGGAEVGRRFEATAGPTAERLATLLVAAMSMLPGGRDNDGVSPRGGGLDWVILVGDVAGPPGCNWMLPDTEPNSNLRMQHVCFACRRIASHSTTSGINYLLTDTLGSVCAETDPTGHAPCASRTEVRDACPGPDYYPYGQEIDYTTGRNPSYRYAGYRLDSNETWQLYYAHARYYAVSASRRSAPGPALPRPP